ncbi:hypothetical protein SSX86_030623 [Deinandra increscens subsp. villosa]|uniref:Co-chaperone protein p23-1 n=1 Tax=Deinandra increscens subsp. villosa TaxID=3103831 RepID=A0AAP0C6U7_9ASTR
MSSDASSSSIVRLNIGGDKFCTTVDTLTHREPNSMLAAMFSGRHTLCKDSEGNVFVDRDGKHFRHVLNWLRNGVLPPNLTDSECSEMLQEAEYYQLLGLADRITEVLNRKKDAKEMDTDLTRTDIIKWVGNAGYENFKLRGVNLSGLDLSNLDLSRVNFSYSCLKNVLFSRADLRFASFENANLEGANLEGANLQHAYLGNANLEGANLKGSNLKRVNLKGAKLNNTDLKGANLQGSYLPHMNLQGPGLVERINEVLNRKKDGKEMDSDLTRTDIIKCVRSKKVNLRGVNLSGLDLSNLDLSGSCLRDCSFVNADLRNALLIGVDLRGANLQGANLEGAHLESAKLNNANLKGANLRCARLRHPEVLWAQRADKVYLTIAVTNAKDMAVKCEPHGSFNFSAIGSKDETFDVSLELYGKILPESCKTQMGLRNILCTVQKEEKGWWKRLLKSEGKPAPHIKVDWNRWCDEDEESENGKFSHYDIHKSCYPSDDEESSDDGMLYLPDLEKARK